MFTNREQKRGWMIALVALLVTVSLIVGASTMPPIGEFHKLAQEPIMAIVWLVTPAILIIGSIVGGLLFHTISKLWVRRDALRTFVSRRSAASAIEQSAGPVAVGRGLDCRQPTRAAARPGEDDGGCRVISLRLTMRTMHRQLAGLSHSWLRDGDTVEEFWPSLSVLQWDMYGNVGASTRCAVSAAATSCSPWRRSPSRRAPPSYSENAPLRMP